MESKRSLTSEEISTIVAGIDPIGVEEMEMLKKLPPGKRWLTTHSKSEAIRADLQNKLMEDFPELSLPEINVKVWSTRISCCPRLKAPSCSGMRCTK